jgi:hypothetical protein
MRPVTASLAWSAAAVALALSAAQPAFAAHSTATFTGTATVNDETGILGTPNANLVTPFTLVFDVNDATPGAEILNTLAPYTQISIVQGDNDANPVRATLTLAGQDFSFGHNYGPPDGTAHGGVARAIIPSDFGFPDGTGVLQYLASTRISDPDFNLDFEVGITLTSLSNFGGTGFDYNRPFTYVFGPDDGVVEADGLYEIDAGNAQAITQRMSFTLAADSVTVTSDKVFDAGGVPEPATWGLMIGGFASLGAALRVQRRPVQVRA